MSMIIMNQASTDGLSSISDGPSVHPSISVHIFIFLMVRPTEYVHEIDGLSSSTVRLRPSRTNNHGLSSEFVHEVDGLSSSGRPPPSIYGKFSWSVVQIRPRDGQSIRLIYLNPQP